MIEFSLFKIINECIITKYLLIHLPVFATIITNLYNNLKSNNLEQQY